MLIMFSIYKHLNYFYSNIKKIMINLKYEIEKEKYTTCIVWGPQKLAWHVTWRLNTHVNLDIGAQTHNP